MKKIILASKSPRRMELLDQINVKYEVMVADIDETLHSDESVIDYVERMAIEKAERISTLPEASGRIVLAADTVVVINNEILGKPVDISDAKRMLKKLSGCEHEVYTSVVVIRDAIFSATNISKVKFRVLSEDEISAYCETGEPLDKAGAYGIQGVAAQYIENLNGSYSGVMGLPLFETKQLLLQAGY